jgi:hypothetical protein
MWHRQPGPEAGAAFLERNSPVNLVCCHLPFLVTLLRRSPPASSLARASTPETLRLLL